MIRFVKGFYLLLYSITLNRLLFSPHRKFNKLSIEKILYMYNLLSLLNICQLGCG